MSKKKEYMFSTETINKLVKKSKSMREFARLICENCSDVSRWCSGEKPVNIRAVLEICRKYPNIKPHQLNAIVFPEDLTFKFKKRVNQ